ncbi:MAG: hypothetical protein JWN14_2518 [Chthonomonadales bacterium]|nr:hypothetical protein [Chthonomonadales bacterium]
MAMLWEPDPHEIGAQTAPGVATDRNPLPETPSVSPVPTEGDIRQAYRARASVLDCLRDPSLSQAPDRLRQMKVEEFLTLLRQESKKRAGVARRYRWASLCLCIGWLAFAISTHFLSGDALYFLCFPIALLFESAMPSSKQQAAALAITQFDDVRAVGPLVEALEFPDTSLRPMFRKTLIRLLPRMKASDAALLSPAHRSALNRVLRGKDADLMLAILKSWEQVGDADAIADVQDLAERGGEGTRLPKVVEAARECLPLLRQSAERQQIGAQLLRPADVNLTPSDVLLRPTLPSASPSDQLLRPGGDV